MKKLLILALFLTSCSTLTPSQKAQITNAATAAAVNALTQYDNTGKVDPAKVAIAAANAGTAPVVVPASAP